MLAPLRAQVQLLLKVHPSERPNATTAVDLFKAVLSARCAADDPRLCDFCRAFDKRAARLTYRRRR